MRDFLTCGKKHTLTRPYIIFCNKPVYNHSAHSFSNDYNDGDDDVANAENRHPHRHHHRQDEDDADNDDDVDDFSVLSSTSFSSHDDDDDGNESNTRYCVPSERCCATATPTSRPADADDVRPPKCGIRNYNPRLEMGSATGPSASAAGGIRASQFGACVESRVVSECCVHKGLENDI